MSGTPTQLPPDEETPENPGECQCCGFETKKLRLFRLPTTIAGGGQVRRNVPFWFCALCASTPASNAHCYPGQYPDAGIMRTVCYVGNALLQALGRRK